MQALSVQPASRAPEKRHRTLEAYLEPIRKACVAASGADTVTIETEAEPIEIDSWMASQIRRGESELISHVAALTLKSRVDRSVLARTDGRKDTTLFTIQAELMLDAAIGLALLRESHQAVQDVVREGDMESAKMLNRVHHDLRRLVAEIKENLADSEHDRADALSDSLTDQPRTGSDEPEALPARAPRQTELSRRASWRKVLSRRPVETPAWFPSSTELLVTALCLALVVWAGMNFLGGAQETRQIGYEDLPTVSIAMDVIARPPSLFVHVSAEDWETLGTEEQQRWLNAVGGRISGDAYVGVLVYDRGGRPLAQWLATGGARDLPRVEGTRLAEIGFSP